MINIKVHTGGKELEDGVAPDRISDLIEQGGQSVLWVDVVEPTADDLRLIGEEFAFHPLAMEDAARRHQRPKVDFYDGFLFIVFYALGVERGSPKPVEIALFVGQNYLVTVHDRDLDEIPAIAERWCRNMEQLGHRGVGLLVYSLLDALVDGYFPVVDELAEQIDEIETGIFERADLTIQERIFDLKKDLLAVRRILGPERDVMNILVRRDTPIFGPEYVVYFADIYDHILRVTDAIDTDRDLLSSALDAYLSVASNRLNGVMKTLTASSIILMSTTLVASIYGMNFAYMPELEWRLGYVWALGLMVTIGATLFAVFRRMDWL